MADSATEAEEQRKRAVAAFLEKLRLVADSGELLDPTVTGRILQLSFESVSEEQEPQPGNCSQEMKIKSRLITRHILAAQDWFQATPNGVKKMEVPGFTINPAFSIKESDQPKLAYTTYLLSYCNDPVLTLRENTETTLQLGTLPRFACITARDIQSTLPNAEFSMATDGVSFYYYSGNKNATTGTTLKFLFRAFAGCALQATIEQSTRYGLRYKKVDYELRDCRNKVMNVYRKDHPPVALTNIRDSDNRTEYGKDVVASEKFVTEQFGTFEQLYYGHKNGFQP